MPQYEYECSKCGEKFSMLRKLSDKDETIECPKCGTPRPRRLISRFATSNYCGTSSPSGG